MKFYTLLLVCIGAVCCAADEPPKSAEEVRQIATHAIATCKNEMRVSDDAIEAFRNGDFLRYSIEEKSKQFIKCYLDEMSVTMFGRIQYYVSMERLGAVFGEKKAKETLDKCFRDPAAIKGNYDYDKALAFYTCFYKNKLVALL